jgi:hypothetical protein
MPFYTLWVALPETALWLFQGWLPIERVACNCLLPCWIPHPLHLWRQSTHSTAQFHFIIILRSQLIQLLHGLVTKNLEPESSKGKGRASPVITLISILLHWISLRTSKQLQSLLRLLGMALYCAGLILHLGSGVVRGDSFNPIVCCWREKSQQQPKVYHSGPILMIQNLVASYEYPSVTRKVLT